MINYSWSFFLLSFLFLVFEPRKKTMNSFNQKELFWQSHSWCSWVVLYWIWQKRRTSRMKNSWTSRSIELTPMTPSWAFSSGFLLAGKILAFGIRPLVQQRSCSCANETHHSLVEDDQVLPWFHVEPNHPRESA